MKKKKIECLNLIDADNSIIEKIKINDIEIEEDYIIRKSQELYCTKDPCIIYHTCIVNDLMLEFQKLLDNNVQIGNLCFEKKKLLEMCPGLKFDDRCERIKIEL